MFADDVNQLIDCLSHLKQVIQGMMAAFVKVHGELAKLVMIVCFFYFIDFNSIDWSHIDYQG